jgi:hypothetical protein
MEKIFNQKNFHYFFSIPLGSRVSIKRNFFLQVHFKLLAVAYWLLVLLIRWQFATSVVDTGGKFAAGIIDTGGKFATGINNNSETGGKICRRVVDTSGKFATGVIDASGAP